MIRIYSTVQYRVVVLIKFVDNGDEQYYIIEKVIKLVLCTLVCKRITHNSEVKLTEIVRPEDEGRALPKDKTVCSGLKTSLSKTPHFFPKNASSPELFAAA